MHHHPLPRRETAPYVMQHLGSSSPSPARPEPVPLGVSIARRGNDLRDHRVDDLPNHAEMRDILIIEGDDWKSRATIERRGYVVIPLLQPLSPILIQNIF